MQRFKNILLVASRAAKMSETLDRAVELARDNQAHLTVVEVLKESSASRDPSDAVREYGPALDAKVPLPRMDSQADKSKALHANLGGGGSRHLECHQVRAQQDHHGTIDVTGDAGKQ